MNGRQITGAPDFGQGLLLPERDPAWGRNAPARQIPFVPNAAAGADPANRWGQSNTPSPLNPFAPIGSVPLSPWTVIEPLAFGAMLSKIVPALAFMAAGAPCGCHGPASMAHTAGAPFWGTPAGGRQIVGLRSPLEAAQRVVAGVRQGDARALAFCKRTAVGAVNGLPEHQATRRLLLHAAKLADRDEHTARYLGVARAHHVQRMHAAGLAWGQTPTGYSPDGQPLYGLPNTYGTLYG